MPVQLHDGCNPINTIALILYMRDAAEYLTEFLVPYLHEMENKYACEFSYYILEKTNRIGGNSHRITFRISNK